MKRIVAVLIGLAAIAVLAWFTWRWATMPIRKPALQVGVDSVGTGLKAARLFFAAPSGDSLVSEAREMPEVQGLHERVAALVQALDRGPTGRGVAALPAGTSVLHVYLDDRGRMTIDLSRAFQQRFRGGANAEYLAVASLIRTVSANVPEVRSVMLVCGGASLPTLGGHVPLDQPIEVSEWP
jgi:hypothetical protein